MEMLSKVRIGTRLAAAFALMLLLLAVMSISALTQAGRLQANTEYYEADLLPAVKTIGAFYQGVSDARRTTFLLITLSDAKEIAKAEQRYASELQSARDQLEAYEQQGLIYDERDRALWADLKQRLGVWSAEHEKVLRANRQRFQEASQAELPRQLVLGEARVVNLALIKAKDEWQRYRDEVALQVLQRGRDTYRGVLWLLGSIAAIALFAGVLASVAITRSITRPLEQAMAITNAVADGDLTVSVHTEGRDELASLLTALGRMSDRLRQMVLAVRGSTDSIASASAQIARGNSDLSNRTEQQAASLQQTAASMQQMAASVRMSSDSAREASVLSTAASSVAERGGSAVGEVVQSMSDIQSASRRIADIISVIDSIAFQTNILALNAAVEAARAGEQGRGFAVVAGEVRSLAQRSAQAAREIKSLINDSVAQIDAGSSRALHTGSTIDDVVDQVRRVSALIQDITASSAEQSSGIGQINAAVRQLDQTTQQNAALVEQTTAAAASLAEQAEQLSRAVAAFRVDGGASWRAQAA